MPKKRGRDGDAPRAPFASPLVCAVLFAALLFLVTALALEGDLGSFLYGMAPTDAPVSTQAPVPAETLPASSGAVPTETPEASPALSPSPGPSDEQAPAETGFQMHVLRVGKADCLLLCCDGQTMLVDGGNTEDEDYIKAYLDARGIERLDYVINTHPHEDHLGALDQIVRAYPVGQAFLSPKTHTTRHYEQLLDALDDCNVPVSIPEPGDTLAFGGSTITFLSPEPDADFGEEINNWSIVFLLEYGRHRFLFMGDAESKAESALRDGPFDLSADVLKVGHHGSNTSSKQRFLEKVSPRYAVITCDKEEEKGEPSDKVLSRLQELDVKIYRTDEDGDVVIRSDGQTLFLP